MEKNKGRRKYPWFTDILQFACRLELITRFQSLGNNSSLSIAWN
jgi:hypothetical protein